MSFDAITYSATMARLKLLKESVDRGVEIPRDIAEVRQMVDMGQHIGDWRKLDGQVITETEYPELFIAAGLTDPAAMEYAPFLIGNYPTGYKKTIALIKFNNRLFIIATGDNNLQSLLEVNLETKEITVVSADIPGTKYIVTTNYLYIIGKGIYRVFDRDMVPTDYTLPFSTNSVIGSGIDETAYISARNHGLYCCTNGKDWTLITDQLGDLLYSTPATSGYHYIGDVTLFKFKGQKYLLLEHWLSGVKYRLFSVSETHSFEVLVDDYPVRSKIKVFDDVAYSYNMSVLRKSNNLIDWTDLNGLPSGTVYDYVVKSDVIVACNNLSNGDSYVSYDGGVTWTPLTNPFTPGTSGMYLLDIGDDAILMGSNAASVGLIKQTGGATFELPNPTSDIEGTAYYVRVR